jgi:hypothetical protein
MFDCEVASFMRWERDVIANIRDACVVSVV